MDDDGSVVLDDDIVLVAAVESVVERIYCFYLLRGLVVAVHRDEMVVMEPHRNHHNVTT